MPDTIHRDLQNSDYLAWIDFLERSDPKSVDEVHAIEQLGFNSAYFRAIRDSATYRNLVQSTFGRVPMNDPISLLKDLPFINKDSFKTKLCDLTRETEGSEYVTTGGSTGVPFGFWRDRLAFSRELASKAHLYRQLGWREGDRQVVFRGLPIDTPSRQEFVEDLSELRLSSYYLTRDFTRTYITAINEYDPQWIRCYPSSLEVFCRNLPEDVRFHNIRGILCASENLYQPQIDLFGTVFPNAQIYSHYGHYELSALAGFCRYNYRYHVLPQYGLVELIGETGLPVSKVGEVGEIVATSFLLDSTNFVRYRTGDLATFGGYGCPDCGRPTMMLDEIHGRKHLFLQSKKQRLVSLTALNMHNKVFEGVSRYQYIQSVPGLVTLRIVERPDHYANLEHISSQICSKLGDDFILSIEIVDDLERTHRGKHRALIQNLEIAIGDQS